jgi:tight adherence protein C
MFELIIEKLTSPSFIAMVLTGIAAAAAVVTVALPFLEKEELAQRMKDVALERDRIRARERERLNQGDAAGKRGPLRHEGKAFIRQLVDDFNLANWLGTEQAKLQLQMAGYRGQQAEYTFIFFRLIMPIVTFIGGVIYAFGFMEDTLMMRVLTSVAAAYAGIKLPELFLRNQINKRQKSVRRAFPDALDLMLICVESGMSIEQAFRKVAVEIGAQSIPLAEELTLATAELSYLSDRRSAFENLGARTGLEGVKSVCMALIQAERYGTPLGSAIRVLSQEFRDVRMNEAEKKAAALPPKLTVPMILFFLPVLFVVILGPAMIEVFGYK